MSDELIDYQDLRSESCSPRATLACLGFRTLCNFLYLELLMSLQPCMSNSHLVLVKSQLNMKGEVKGQQPKPMNEGTGGQGRSTNGSIGGDIEGSGMRRVVKKNRRASV